MSENKIVPVENNSISIFENQDKFEVAQRMAMALSKSTIVPQDYRNNVSNALVALDMSNRMGMSPMMVMQNLYIVKGRPSWSSQFIIAAINSSKRYSESLKFKLEGKGEEMSCYAYAKDYEGEEITGPVITMKMAKTEEWSTKLGSKWKTMPEVMIRYRAASFFGRLYCSDLLMGIYSDEENGGNLKAKIDVTEEVPDTFNTVKDKVETDENIIETDYEEFPGEDDTNGTN
ncbi:hypothetical protein [Clostridium sp. FP1]|uniref:hypothetical protein n=1 Tax=Clostridium sp. FP1 TaxID=2724076 RepID=UPI0013E92797|nr:hypothetical protein [Clostridium sp. FP1]MBZ9633161.1 hypothetical protein [Clostridium sp. FP1]